MTSFQPSLAPRVGVVHAPFGAAGLREIYAAARGLCEVVLILRSEVISAYPDVVAAARTLFDTVEYPDGGPADLAELNLAGITTFHDSELDVVDEAVRALNLPGQSRLVNPWDKLVQRECLAAHGLWHRRATAVDSREDFENAVRYVGMPGVLKPRRSAGGNGISFISDLDDITHQLADRPQWTNLLFESMIPAGTHPSGVPWLTDSVSVETVSTGCERTHVAIFDRPPISLVARAGENGADSVIGTGDVTPSRLPSEVAAEVLRYTSAVLEALQVAWRVTHTELRLTPTGVDVIEVNGRVGGQVSRLLGLLAGPDVVRAALCVSLGRDPDLAVSAAAGYAARLLPPFPERCGRVRSEVSGASLRALPGVVGVDVVARHGNRRSDTDFCATNVVLHATDVTELDRNVRATTEGVASLFRDDGLMESRWLAEVLVGAFDHFPAKGTEGIERPQALR